MNNFSFAFNEPERKQESRGFITLLLFIMLYSRLKHDVIHLRHVALTAIDQSQLSNASNRRPRYSDPRANIERRVGASRLASTPLVFSKKTPPIIIYRMWSAFVVIHS